MAGGLLTAMHSYQSSDSILKLFLTRVWLNYCGAIIQFLFNVVVLSPGFYIFYNSHFRLVVLAISFEEVRIILFSLVKMWLVLNTSKHEEMPFPASLALANSLCHLTGANLNKKILQKILHKQQTFTGMATFSNSMPSVSLLPSRE